MKERINVGVAGLGTVGFNVAHRLLEQRQRLFERSGLKVDLCAVAEPEITPDQRDLFSKQEIYSDAGKLLEEADLDVLVELIGGLQPAGDLIKQALERGIDVVTANKELLAKNGREIFKTATANDARIRFEAAVAGSIPIIRTIREAMVDAEFECIYGIINGTTNYVLSRMARTGMDFDTALDEAREKGYAEADPADDIEGKDSANKLTIIGELAFGSNIPIDRVYTEGIEEITPEIMEDAERLGYCIKLLGIAKKSETGIDIRVHPTMIPTDSALAAVNREYNAIYLQSSPAGASMLYGKGAGGPSTSEAVIGDIVSLADQERDFCGARYYSSPGASLIPAPEVSTRYYLRLMALDKPGVLAQVTRILGEHKISIETVIQHGRSAGELVPVILTTHRAREGSVREAVKAITELEVIGRKPQILRIEEGFERE